MSAPAPPPPPPPPPSKSNQPMHYFDLSSELKWASKNKSSPNPTRRGRHHKPPNKKPPSSGLAAPKSSQLPREGYICPWLEGEMAKQLSRSSIEGSSSSHVDIPKSNSSFHGPRALLDYNSEFDSSYLDFIMSLADSPIKVNEVENSEAMTLQKFQKELSISGMHMQINKEEQMHEENVNKKGKLVEDEDKGKEMQAEIENKEDKKDVVGKEGKNQKLYLSRSKIRGKELINEEIGMQIPMAEKEVPADEKDEPRMDAYPGESNETVTKSWNLRQRKPHRRPQNVNTNAPVSSKVGGGSVPKNKDKQQKEDSEKEQESGGDRKKGKQKINECKKNAKGKKTDKGQEGNETGRPKLPKFSLQLTDEEIAEDLYAMTGARPSRKPKRRSKNAQREIDRLTPGLYLDSITPDSYKVNENTGKGK